MNDLKDVFIILTFLLSVVLLKITLTMFGEVAIPFWEAMVNSETLHTDFYVSLGLVIIIFGSCIWFWYGKKIIFKYLVNRIST